MTNPIVNGIEKDLVDKAEVVRLNLMSSLGKEMASRYDVTRPGITILLDGAGKIVYRHQGIPNKQKILDELSRC